MRTISIAAAMAAAWLAPAYAQAQDAPPPPPPQDMSAPAAAPSDTSAPPVTPGRSPDGSKLFGFIPYVGVTGGWESFDNEPHYNVPQAINADGSRRTNYRLQGGVVQGVVGANLPLGPGFVGIEGNVQKGFSGNIDWEYGVSGRAGFRAGDSGLIYGRAGYQWVQFDHFGAITPGADTGRKYGDWEYGLGVEVGPKDIGLKGLTGNAGIRLRAELDTYGDFHSIGPKLGVVTHF